MIPDLQGADQLGTVGAAQYQPMLRRRSPSLASAAQKLTSGVRFLSLVEEQDQP
jgi:hypothetical protein